MLCFLPSIARIFELGLFGKVFGHWTIGDELRACVPVNVGKDSSCVTIHMRCAA
jgi:hypothetical protein